MSSPLLIAEGVCNWLGRGTLAAGSHDDAREDNASVTLSAIREPANSLGDADRTLGEKQGSIDMTTRLLVETTRTLAQTRRCLAATQRCIAVSRRLLNRAWGVSGAADVEPQISIRERLERGALSLASRSVAARWGTGQACIICERMIAPSEIANGSIGNDGVRVWTHLTCLRIWRAETAAFELRQIDRERSAQGELCTFVRRGFANRSIELLPHNRSRLGRGVNGPCSVCGKHVSPNETAHEVVGGVLGQPAYAHPTCYRAWWVESMAHRKSLA